MSLRPLLSVIPSVPTSDGAGVKLRRALGAYEGQRLDPFLMLDEFYSDDPRDYIAGFPAHPHRGFETVTYMLDGHLRHEDHLGNRGELRSGGVQWMTAGRGIIHSEMPQQDSGRMRGFQLWINLPAAEKMKPAGYRDIPAEALARSADGRVTLIAGQLTLGALTLRGPVNGGEAVYATDPLYADLHLGAGDRLELPVQRGHQSFLYVYEGEAEVIGEHGGRALPLRSAGILGDGDQVQLRAGERGARALLLAGKPLREPIVQYGPFVMNTHAEIERAVRDYQTGRLTL